MRLLSKGLLLVRATTASVVLAALVAGCAAPAEHPALDQAVAAVERARGAPRVRALAAAELDRAEVALEQAGAAARAGASPDQVAHLAYVVSQRAALAEARAAERVARSEVGKLQRAFGQAVAHSRLEQDGFRRASLRNQRQRRGLGQAVLEQDRQAWASSAQPDQQADRPLQDDRHERASVQTDQGTGVPLNRDELERAPVQQDPRARALLEEDQSERALGEVRLDQQQRRLVQTRLEQDRQAWASSAQPDQRPGARLRADQRERASAQQDPQTRALLGEGGEAGAPLEGDPRGRASVQQDRQEARAPLEGDPRERASVQQDRQTRRPLEIDRSERALLEQDQRGRAAGNEDRRARGSVNENQQARASAAGDQDAGKAEPDGGAAILGTVRQEITLSLAQLPFQGAEPTGEAIEQLTALAERLLREPGPNVSIEARFDLPDPEARTEMERRVEVVRAILVQRGIAPARLVVRAVGDGAMEPPASSSFIEPPD
jgi:Domain of unknown function (DUF4398)